jgi:hypothetical protein
MVKRVTDLNEAISKRSGKTASDREAPPDRPRLAERLVELAPLARGPVTIEREPAREDIPEPSLDLSRLAAALRHPSDPPPLRDMPAPPTALVPSPEVTMLVRTDPPVPLMRQDSRPPPLSEPVSPEAPHASGNARGFLIGLLIAVAVGAGLYAVLH